MKKIEIIVYGYKNKTLPECVENLINNQSGNYDLSITVLDQVNLRRQEKFQGHNYIYRFWDTMTSRYRVLGQRMKNLNADYLLFIDGSIMFEKNWDMELVMGHGGQNIVMSGNKKIIFDSSDYKFLPQYTKENISTTVQTDWINKDFIFMSRETANILPNPEKLKWDGLEELWSLFCVTHNIGIYAIATAWYNKISLPLSGYDYIPFSRVHNYDMIIDIFKSKTNELSPVVLDVPKLSHIHSYDFGKLSYMPFAHDDISYDPSMDIDNMASERFHEVIKELK